MATEELNTVAAPVNDLIEIKKQVHATIHKWDNAHYSWYITFILLSIVAIVLPLLIASALLVDVWWNRILAFVTAVCVAVLGWANIGAAAAKFDQARTLLRIALVSSPNDHSKLSDAYRAAMIAVQGNGQSPLPAQAT
jgi:hypothetical protein